MTKRKNSNVYIDEFILPTCDLFINYLMNGKVDEQVINKIRIDNIKNLDLKNLLKLAFLRNKDVVKFINDLDEAIRRIKISSSREKVKSRGQVRGSIDWSKTIKYRLKENYTDKTLLVLNSPFKLYDLPENQLLKKLIINLKNLFIDEFINTLFNRYDYDWLKETKGNRLQINQILRNVHIKRIKTPKLVNQLMLNASRRSRSTLYRNTYIIYSLFEDLLRFFDHEVIKDVLKNELISPDNVWAVFELFVLFKFIKSFESIGFKILSFKSITEFRKETCILEKEGIRVTIFYNVNSDLSFINKSRLIDDEAKKVSASYFNKKLYDGSRRPDITLKIERNGVERFIFVEVKYTKNVDYVLKGVYQALDYLQIAKKNEDSLSPFNEHFGDGYNAIVATYRVPLKNKKENLKNEDLKVKIFNYDDLMNKLQYYLLMFIKL